MGETIDTNIQDFCNYISTKGFRILSDNTIDYGRQLLVTDDTHRCPVNFYDSGKIVVGGKSSSLKDDLTEWANLQQSGIKDTVRVSPQIRNRIAKFLVIPENIENVRKTILPGLPGEVEEKSPSGSAELYRLEVRRDPHRVTVTQYQSGTLMIQGLSSPLFDDVCDVLDTHLSQSFSARAARYIPGNDEELSKAESYLDSAEAENEAVSWLHEQIGQRAIEFCFQNDQNTLIAAAGVRNAIKSTKLNLPDYSVVVMPFAKAFEGFLIRLAIHLSVAEEAVVREKASEIVVANWLVEIEKRIPDRRRYGESIIALKAAWECRHKAIHSDPEYPYSILPTLTDAEAEISTIVRAIRRAYGVFCEEGLALPQDGKEATGVPDPNKFTYTNVDRQALYDQLIRDSYEVVPQEKGKRNEWEILSPPDLIVVAPSVNPGLIIVEGNDAPLFISRYRQLLEARTIPKEPQPSERPMLRIGVDESGKGDLFGPLVIAGVVLTPESEIVVAKHGVKDSKSLSDSRILDLSAVIRQFCEHEVITLLPPEYNQAYSEHNQNLNNLLAWGHAEIISRLHGRTQARIAVSDQFADENLILRELEGRGITIDLEQRPHAEDDLAVAAASILARAAFIKAIQDYTIKSGIEIPRGSSSHEVKKVADRIYDKWGLKGLERICKMHFKTIKQVISEGKK